MDNIKYIEEMDFIEIKGLRPKRKYISFVSALRGSKVRLIRNSAFLLVKQLSSVLDDVILKITINDDNSIDIKQTSGLFCDEDQIKRIFSIIDEYEYTPYAEKYIVSNVSFEDENNDLCYLEVEYKRPIDRFKDLLDEFENEKEETKLDIEDIIKNSKTNISSFLDDLLGSEEEIIDVEKEEEYISSSKEDIKPLSYLESIFSESKQEQKNSLIERIEEKEKELLKKTIELDNLNNKIKKTKEDIELLRSRLSSMQEIDPSNGIIFSISEQINTPIKLDDSHDKLISAISDNLGININKLKSIITEPSYKIFLKSKDSEKKLEDFYRTIYLIDPNGYFEVLDEGTILYKGTLNWHKLIDSMLRKGFSQDSDFDTELGDLLKTENLETDG